LLEWATYVKLALELPVAPELDKNHLVEQQPDEVEGLGDVAGFFSTGIGHDDPSRRMLDLS